jgi:hypothetical protein
MSLYQQLISKLISKKTFIFFALFFSIPFLIIYVQARSENRNNYSFVVIKVENTPTGHLNVSNKKSEFNFCNFNTYKADIQVGDSISKKAFSKELFVFRKDLLSNKYKKHLEFKEAGTFPIDWQ